MHSTAELLYSHYIARTQCWYPQAVDLECATVYVRTETALSANVTEADYVKPLLRERPTALGCGPSIFIIAAIDLSGTTSVQRLVPSLLPHACSIHPS